MDFDLVTEQLIKHREIFHAENAIEAEINIQPLIDKENGFEIVCEESAKQALSMSLQAKKLKKSLDEARKKIVKPHIDFQRAVNDLAKSYTSTLESIEERLKEKIEIWLESQKSLENSFLDIKMEVEDGKLSEKSKWDFEIEDMDLVPREFLTVDEKKVKASIKMGVRDIDGIKIFEKKTLTTRVRNG